jgi:hypothetical protein
MADGSWRPPLPLSSRSGCKSFESRAGQDYFRAALTRHLARRAPGSTKLLQRVLAELPRQQGQSLPRAPEFRGFTLQKATIDIRYRGRAGSTRCRCQFSDGSFRDSCIAANASRFDRLVGTSCSGSFGQSRFAKTLGQQLATRSKSRVGSAWGIGMS